MFDLYLGIQSWFDTWWIRDPKASSPSRLNNITWASWWYPTMACFATALDLGGFRALCFIPIRLLRHFFNTRGITYYTRGQYSFRKLLWKMLFPKSIFSKKVTKNEFQPFNNTPTLHGWITCVSISLPIYNNQFSRVTYTDLISHVKNILTGDPRTFIDHRPWVPDSHIQIRCLSISLISLTLLTPF